MEGSTHPPNRFIPRKKPARGVRIASGQPMIVYATVCTQGRLPWLATRENHEALVELWRNEATAWLVGRYTLMPDHVHLFAGMADEGYDFDNWTRYWKRRFGQIRKLPPHSLQEGKWEKRVRTSRQYEEKWEYVRCNPVRHGLVARAEEWPYSGEIHEVGWPD